MKVQLVMQGLPSGLLMTVQYQLDFFQLWPESCPCPLILQAFTQWWKGIKSDRVHRMKMELFIYLQSFLCQYIYWQVKLTTSEKVGIAEM